MVITGCFLINFVNTRRTNIITYHLCVLCLILYYSLNKKIDDDVSIFVRYMIFFSVNIDDIVNDVKKEITKPELLASKNAQGKIMTICDLKYKDF